MVTKRAAEEQAQITSMLQEIEATPTGGAAVKALRQERYRVRFGRPLGGGAFTYPWRVITVRRGYSPFVTRSMLIHELGHTLFMSTTGRFWSASIEQEHAADRFWAQVSRELGALSRREHVRWLGPEHDADALYDEIRQASTWHRISLPRHQPHGLPDKLWALWQAAAATLWILPLLLPWRLGQRRRRGRRSSPGQGPSGP
jgi:hypothetical protein